MRPADVAERLRATPQIQAVEAALGGEPAWVVGGTVRDAALGREINDFDIAFDGNTKKLATKVARKLRGSPFRMSAEFGTWRVTGPEAAWTLDFTSLRGPGIEADLDLRDFTINAVALPLAGGADAPVLDPHDGFGDLGRRRLVAVSDQTFSDDPLRLMRAVRQAAELGLVIDEQTVNLAAATVDRALEPAAERIYMELRALLAGPDPIGGLGLLAELGLEAQVLPELHALRGLAQGPYHHLDAYEHTIDVLRQTLAFEAGEVDDRLGGEPAAEARRLLSGNLGDGISRFAGLRFAAILHDVGKVKTRAVMPSGKVGFPGHDSVGAEMIRALFKRLRSSNAVAGYIAGLTAGHLRLGFMVHGRPHPPRTIHGYLRAAHPWAVDLTLLTVADRLATRGRKADEAIAAHLDLAREMLERSVSWEVEGPPPLPIRGRELAEAIGIDPGPELGRILTELEADVYEGGVHDRDSAIAKARELAT